VRGPENETRGEVDAPGGQRPSNSKAPERKGSRPRGDAGAPGGSVAKPAPEPRRKRGSEPRYVGFGDEIERAYCLRDTHVLPSTFPVASHAGAATIAPRVVARRPGALLLCTYSHAGEHVWPDGEVVADGSLERTMQVDGSRTKC
jgi:hypothetical protein